MRCFRTILLILTGATVSMSAYADDTYSQPPSYNWMGGGYLWGNSGEEFVNDAKGFAVAGSYEVLPRLVFQAALEHAKIKVDPDLADIRFKETAYVATLGTYFPLSERLHLTIDLGLDYETIKGKGSAITPGDSVKADELFANAVIGLKAKPTDRLEIGASLQRLENFKKNTNSNWVSRADAFYAISSGFDLAASFAYENDEPGALVGGRIRF